MPCVYILCPFLIAMCNTQRKQDLLVRGQSRFHRLQMASSCICLQSFFAESTVFAEMFSRISRSSVSSDSFIDKTHAALKESDAETEESVARCSRR